jgi:hypothetical protein
VANVDLQEDKLLLECIWRANLDAFWSRDSSTVLGNRDKMKYALKLSAMVNLSGPYEHVGTMPSKDHCGYEVAIQMLLASQRPGRYSKAYTQWDTIRKIRTVYSNQVKTSPQANQQVMALGNDKGQSQRLVQDQCSSYWFSRFFIGCRRRMGQDWRPNKGMSAELIVEILSQTSQRISESESQDQKVFWLTFGTFLTVSYVLSLRGGEGLLLDLNGIRKNNMQAQTGFIIIALLGKVKGEHRDRCHLLPCVNVTSSGINVRNWVEKLMILKGEMGCVNGPLIANMDGSVMSTARLDGGLLEILEEIFDNKPNLFQGAVTCKEELGLAYQVFRSPRRTSDTRAIEQQVAKIDIEVVNRWKVVEGAQGNRPAHQMHQHYAQFDLLLKPFLRYTVAM